MVFFLSFIFSFPIASIDTSKDLEEVIVTSNIIRQDIRSTGRNVFIIDKKTIEASPARTIDALLQYALNVDVRSRSSQGVQADISIRGGHYDQTLIMIDGIKVNDPQTGHHAINFPISIQQIEKIEILQGGASRTLGPNAFSGVINIITKKVTESKLHLNGSVGDHKLLNYMVGTDLYLKPKKLYLQTFFDKSSSKGFLADGTTKYDKWAFNAKGGVAYKTGEFHMSFGMFDNEFGAANFYSNSSYQQYEEVASNLLSLNWSHIISKKITGTLLGTRRVHYDYFD
ncbi:MAG: TonB-dependent receptor, partial [Leadbetterella sp.]